MAVINASGARQVTDLGLDEAVAAGAAVQQHLDSSEQRPHLAGTLGAVLLDRLLTLGWLHQHRVPGAVTLTHTGRGELNDRLGIQAIDASHRTPLH